MIKNTILFILVLTIGVWAGMIDYVDDDPVQYLEFSNCDTSIVARMIIGIMVNPDSGYAESQYDLVDTCYFNELGYNRPLYDSRGRTMAGDYDGEYWFYQVTVLHDGTEIVPADTAHVRSTYPVSGCGGIFHND